MIVLIGWSNSGSIVGLLIWGLVILFSVIVHEYGHALTALAFGQEAQIELIAFGGVTHRKGPKLKAWKEFVIVLNGPLAGFLLSMAAYVLLKQMGQQPSILLYIVEVTWIANLFWTVLNLLPIYPLDGGHLLRIILESIFGVRGMRFAFIVSALLALFTSYILFTTYHSLIGGALFLMLAYESYRSWQSSRYISTQDNDEILQQKYEDAESDFKIGNMESAKRKFEDIRLEAVRGTIYLTATELLAHIYAKEGRMEEAYKMLLPHKNDLSLDSLRLLQESAYRSGAFRDAAHVGNRLYQNHPNYESALMNALSYSLLGEVRPCVGWLQRAIKDGLPKPIIVLHREEFDGIRNASEFKDLERKLTA